MTYEELRNENEELKRTLALYKAAVRRHNEESNRRREQRRARRMGNRMAELQRRATEHWLAFDWAVKEVFSRLPARIALVVSVIVGGMIGCGLAIWLEEARFEHEAMLWMQR